LTVSILTAIKGIDAHFNTMRPLQHCSRQIWRQFRCACPYSPAGSSRVTRAPADGAGHLRMWPCHACAAATSPLSNFVAGAYLGDNAQEAPAFKQVSEYNDF
jgi:hypothetical protein